MTEREMLGKVRLVGDVFEDAAYLAVVERTLGGGMVEVGEKRRLSEEEIEKTVFQLARVYLTERREAEHTFAGGEVQITISMKEVSGDGSGKE